MHQKLKNLNKRCGLVAGRWESYGKANEWVLRWRLKEAGLSLIRSLVLIPH